MSAAIHCPSCGHSLPSRARLGLAIHCERCQKIVTPQAQSFEPLIEPEMVGARFAPDVDAPSGMTAFLTIFLLVGVMMLLCGGIGGYMAINSHKRIIAKAEQVEEMNRQRQRELEAQQKARARPQPTPPRPARKVTPQPTPPQIAPPTILPIEPPNAPPISVESPQPVAEPPKQPPRVPRLSPAGKSLDELLIDLNDEQSKRPAWIALHELTRLPMQEDRKADVSAALDRHLRSRDTLTLNAAVKVSIAWGTEWNAEALLALIDSPHVVARWDAMRTLARVRPTAETAELLLSQARDLSNIAALRDALKDLGPVGEQAMFDYLQSDDRQLKQSILHLLGEVGSKSAVEPLEKLIAREPDVALKGLANLVLQRIKTRQP